MNRLLQTSVLLIATAVLASGPVLAATPPKGDDAVSGPKDFSAGNPANAAGSTKRTIDPIRSGVSEAGWLEALRQVQVTELQAPLITRMVRAYLDQSEIWRQTMGLELDLVVGEVQRIRGAGGDIPPELATRVRMIRGSMPKWGGTQRLILSELTPTQVESLLLQIDRVKAKQREKLKAENRRRARGNPKTTTPADGAERPAVIAPAAKPDLGAAANASKPLAPKPWSFVQSEEATPTEPADEAETPVKADG